VVKLFGALVALVLVGVSAYLIGANAHCPPVPQALSVHDPSDAPREDLNQATGGLPSEAVQLAHILVGQPVPSDASFPNYYELCVSLRGGLGGSERCPQLRDASKEKLPHTDES
jgi:hypothetical protein